MLTQRSANAHPALAASGTAVPSIGGVDARKQSEPQAAARGRERLAATFGYRVACTDGHAGIVETPLFHSSSDEPDFLVVRDVGARRLRIPVPTALVSHVDHQASTIVLRATRRELEALPANLPLSRRV